MGLDLFDDSPICTSGITALVSLRLKYTNMIGRERNQWKFGENTFVFKLNVIHGAYSIGKKSL